MKSTVSIFLLCYFSLAAFVPRMDFDRLYQIPDLAAHFFEHEGPDDSLDFIEFINIHYGQESEEPTDGHELPFQEHDCCISCHTFASFSLEAGRLDFEAPIEKLKDSYISHFTSKHIADIWQPPRA